MMMNRNDCAYIGFGHGGSKIVDGLMTYDPRYIGYFINTSMYDIRSLENYDEITKNYYHIPQADGVGGNREMGKRYAQKNGWNILDILKRFDQSTLCFTYSFGGGSGSSIATIVLGAIEELKADPEEDFDKTINVIGILPRLDSPAQVLRNAVETWSELMAFECVSNMYFIDNNNTFDGEYLSESDINEYFIQLFDAIYEIPNESNDVFDGADLGTMFTSKGCSYIYELPSGYENVEEALKYAYNHSVLAKMYQNTDNLIVDNDDGIQKMKCEYLGTSLSDEKYTHEDVLKLYKPMRNKFKGANVESNYVLVSGCLPPFYSIQVIMAELKDREIQEHSTNTVSYNKFIIPLDRKAPTNNKPTVKVNNSNKKRTMKKTMKKKNLFDFVK